MLHVINSPQNKLK